MANSKSVLLNMHLSTLKQKISQIESLTVTEQTQEEYNKIIQKIKLAKHLIESVDANSQQNALATSELKRLGLNHPEMRPWLSELLFKNGIENEKAKIDLRNKINTTCNNFAGIASDPNIDIKQYEEYQGWFESLRDELIKAKDSFTPEEYNNLLQELEQGITYVNGSLSMYKAEESTWENDNLTL